MGLGQWVSVIPIVLLYHDDDDDDVMEYSDERMELDCPVCGKGRGAGQASVLSH